jgi:uncharacterized protein
MSNVSRIETPCISICQIDRLAGVCTGCKRTIQEIAHWLSYTHEQRRGIMDELPKRSITPS